MAVVRMVDCVAASIHGEHLTTLEANPARGAIRRTVRVGDASEAAASGLDAVRQVRAVVVVESVNLVSVVPGVPSSPVQSAVALGVESSSTPLG
jgi:hypothetical protein